MPINPCVGGDRGAGGCGVGQCADRHVGCDDAAGQCGYAWRAALLVGLLLVLASLSFALVRWA